MLRRLTCTAVLVAGLLSTTVAHAAEISLRSQVEGNFVNVGIYGAGFDDLVSFDFLVDFDPLSAAFVSVSAGDLLPPLATFVGYSPVKEIFDEQGELIGVEPIPNFSPVTILGVITGTEPGVKVDGLLATLLFETIAASGWRFDVTPVKFFNSSLEEIEVTVAQPQPVPEPSTLGLLGIGLAAMARRMRRRKPATASIASSAH